MLLSALAAGTAPGQKASIEIRKVHTLVDRDGRGFIGLPREIAAVPRGRFLLMDDVESRSPAVLDSSGKFLKDLGRVGQGPGELAPTSGPFRATAGDTLFVRSGGQVHIYSSDLHHLRSLRPQVGPYDFVVTPTGLFIARSTGSTGNWTPFHITDREGKTLRSVGRDTSRYPAEYLLSLAPGNAVWAATRMGHRFERWTLDGTRTQVIDHVPAWWKQIKAGAPDPFTLLRAAREVNGVLWVLSMNPAPNIREIMRAAGERGAARDGGGPPLPMDKMYTAMLEAYDAKTGKPVAELAVAKAPVTILDDRHFVVYSVDGDGMPQLEIWEMTLKR